MSTNDAFFAYGQDKAALEVVMRLHAVKRWHMIDTTRVQTLAEHTANVALLAFLIAKTIGDPTFPESTHSNIAVNALIHDLGETLIGDIPTHTKRAAAKSGSALADLEQSVIPAPFRNVLDASTRSALLIKVCDLADGIRFIRLHGVDVTARHAREGLEFQFNDKLREALNEWPIGASTTLSLMANFYAYELS